MSNASAVIVVGHPSIDRARMQRMLSCSGAQIAQPSRREGLLPSEISEILRRAAGAPDLDRVSEAREIAGVWSSALHRELGVDLLLANLNRGAWGWVDPQAIYLLQYWRDLLPRATFVFVYDHPGRVLSSVAWKMAGSADQCVAAAQSALAGWKCYNEVLLQFFLRNPDHCVLVHRDSLEAAPLAWSGIVGSALGAAVDPPPPEGLEDRRGYDPSADDPNATGSSLLVPGDVEVNSSLERVQWELVERTLDHYPDVLQLYEDLQSSASCGVDLRMASDPTDALGCLGRLRSRLLGVDGMQRENASILRQLHSVQAKLEEVWSDREEACREKERTKHALVESERLIRSLASRRDAMRLDKNRRIQQLKSKVEHLQVRLDACGQAVPDLTRTTTRTLCWTVVSRVLSRILPPTLNGYLRKALRRRNAPSRD